MGVYHLSACHDCKEKIMWDKTNDSQAYLWHTRTFKKLHPEHNTELGNDYDDDFYDKIWKYKYFTVKIGGSVIGV